MNPALNPKCYPRPGTQAARVLECLAAEPCRALEVTRYLDHPLRRMGSAVLNNLRVKGLVRKRPDKLWELVSPETDALVYGEEESA